MFKRVTIVALVVAAFLLMVAVPAMAFNGYRGDYTTTPACKECHNGRAGIPSVYPQWSESKHGTGEAYLDVYNRLPYGSVCQGCHTSNFAPSKLTPVPTATSTSGAVSWAASPAPSATGTAFPMDTQASGDLAWSESYIGCSSCHYGSNALGDLAVYGVDVNDTAHNAPYGQLANADICGACHSRYSYTKDTYAVQPVPYLTVTLPLPGTPVTPNPSATSLIQPQMAIGYPMLGSPAPSPSTGWDPAAPLSAYLITPVSNTGWSTNTMTPTPTATTGGFGKLQTYWQVNGGDSLWQQTGHDGSAAQYPEWASEGHASALNALTSQAFWQFFTPAQKAECLKCHSADYRIMDAAGELNTPEKLAAFTPKYGVTCVGCHAPHDAGTVKGVWDKGFDAQLVNDSNLAGNGSNLCTECHNGEIPAGTTASPGAEIHHPMKEMMDGYGAIDVAAFPSVHKGKCIQCHMPPTSLSRGSVQLGANHTFNIITPQDAVDATPVPYATATTKPTSTPTPAGSATAVATTIVTVTQDSMPYSACSTCHANNNGVKATPVPVSTTFATANPTASPLAVTATVVQNADGSSIGNMTGGDKALWLQDTIDQRQSWTKAKITEIHTELDKAAVVLGYADTAAAQAGLITIPQNQWTTAQRAFLTSFTNVGYVESEGSYGLHNWDYSREIVNAAMSQAKIAESGVIVRTPWKVTLKISKTSVRVNTNVKFTGTVKTAKGVAGAGQVILYRLKRPSGVWKRWQAITLKADGSYSLTKRMTSKGTFLLRSTMSADSLNTSGKSTPNLQLVVR